MRATERTSPLTAAAVLPRLADLFRELAPLIAGAHASKVLTKCEQILTEAGRLWMAQGVTDKGAVLQAEYLLRGIHAATTLLIYAPELTTATLAILHEYASRAESLLAGCATTAATDTGASHE